MTVFTRLSSRIGARYARILDWIDSHLLSLGLGGLLFLLLIAALSPRIFITIPPGHEGALFRRFQGGTDVQQAYDEGFHVIFPWNIMYIYDVRFQNQTAMFDAHTSDGLAVRVEVAYRYRVTRRNVPLLNKYIGPDYVHKLILPALGARVREEVARFTPQELYSTKRIEIQEHIRDAARRGFEMNPEANNLLQRVEFIELDEIYLRNVELPEALQKSIAEKDQQQQMMLEYDYRIEREKKEAERKRIEAEGIRQFQDIVKDGITDRYLMWRGIDATLQLAQSPNTKVIVIGAGKTGLPILLGNLDSTITPPSGSQPRSTASAPPLTPLANTPDAPAASEASPPGLSGSEVLPNLMSAPSAPAADQVAPPQKKPPGAR